MTRIFETFEQPSIEAVRDFCVAHPTAIVGRCADAGACVVTTMIQQRGLPPGIHVEACPSSREHEAYIVFRRGTDPASPEYWRLDPELNRLAWQFDMLHQITDPVLGSEVVPLCDAIIARREERAA